MKRSLIFIFILISIGGATLYFLSTPPPSRPVSQGQSPTELPTLKGELPTEAKRNLLAIPELKKIRTDVEMHPHEMSPALIAFATTVTQEMEFGLRSEDNARQSMMNLKNCVNANAYVPVQTFCLRNIKLLSERFPKLSSLGDSIFSSASNEALDLLR